MILIGTSALYAVLDRDDEHHPVAKDTWGRLLRTDEILLATNHVGETTALVQHRLGMAAVRVLCDDMVRRLEETLDYGDRSHRRPKRTARNGSRKLSLVDCSGFQIMRSRMVPTAFAFDPHSRE